MVEGQKFKNEQCKSIVKANKQEANNMISHKMDGLTLQDEELLLEEDSMDEPTKKTSEYAGLKNLSIAEMIEASNRKVKEKQNKELVIDSDSEYDLTDYSSN